MAATITGSGGYGLISTATAQSSTSGTSIDFGSIPAGVKRITVMFSGVSTNGSSTPYLIQIGTSGGIETTNYLGSGGYIANLNPASTNNNTNGFALVVDNSATNVIHGSLTISLLNSSTNTWVASGMFGASDRAFIIMLGYSKVLSGTLDRVRVTTANGTDAFDAGTINILYE